MLKQRPTVHASSTRLSIHTQLAGPCTAPFRTAPCSARSIGVLVPPKLPNGRI
jgi:hypothetical protein